MKASDIFTPGSLPQYTYYDRAELNLEFRLLEAIETRGMISSVAGPSKSGKTVLCESVIGKRGMLLIPGGGISSEDLFWHRVRSRLKIPVSKTTASTVSTQRETSVKGGVEGSVYVVKAKGEAERKNATGQESSQTDQYEGAHGIELLERVRDLGFTLVVDDFHYIEESTQKSLSEQFKEAARSGAKIVVVSVTHRIGPGHPGQP